MSHITILTTDDGAKLAKRISQKNGEWQKSAYDFATTFDIETFEAHNLDDLSTLLTALESLPQSCLVRGRKIAGRPSTNSRRLRHDDGAKLATFEDFPAQWLMIDVDDLPADPALSNEDRLGSIISILPPAFQDVDFHYQWSNSAGLNGWNLLRCHLFFWLDKPIKSDILRQQADAENWACDLSLFNPVQIHYTAAPIFENCDDPLDGQRSGLVKRSNRSVVLPAWAPPAPIFRASHSTNLPHSIEDCLAEIGPDYHLPILRAAKRYVQIHGLDADLYELRRMLTEAIWIAPPGRNPKSGYLNSRYLDRVIDGAVRKFSTFHSVPRRPYRKII